MLRTAALLLFLTVTAAPAGETLRSALQAANIPVEAFSSSELARPITSYAVSNDDPFLISYYVDDGSGMLKRPLYVVRYDLQTGDIRRGEVRTATALFQGSVPEDCLGSALSIREHDGRVFIDTHDTPSAGCVIVLSAKLGFETALSGGILGFIGPDCLILRGSEIHFMSVHPLHLTVLDLQRNRSTPIYPYAGDAQRRLFSDLIDSLMSDTWCRENNAQCDPDNFDVDISGAVVINEAARTFAFQARFDAAGFGDAALKRVPPRTVAYFFRERAGRWEHREFSEPRLRRLLAGATLTRFIAEHPSAAFQR